MSLIETRPLQEIPEAEPSDDDDLLKGIITESDELTVKVQDGRGGEYIAHLKPDLKDGIPIITETPRNGSPAEERYHLDSRVTAFLTRNGEDHQRIWEEVPSRNVVTPRFAGGQVKVAIIAAREGRASQ